MIVYVVQYDTGYDHNEIIGYFLNKEDAEIKAQQAEKDNPGMGFYVSEIEMQ